ncbi:biogenesis of lysosomal organelles complex 1 subunit pallidin isoform X1 [Lycorma delicatula]|uniref:biogenesis of lysosomal organelles complex 1 subunit pallidin isoform X1 n=1 Tax=Lycorma delicatula TaxID=130591 RepID=UPI003F50EC3C
MAEFNENHPEEIKIEEGVEKLSDGLLKLYEPTFKDLQSNLNELTNKQLQLVDQVETENLRLKRMENKELKEMFLVVKDYLARLHSIKNDMISLSERSAKLKKRALRLHQQKQNEALEREQLREAQLTREQELIAKPSKSSA